MQNEKPRRGCLAAGDDPEREVGHQPGEEKKKGVGSRLLGEILSPEAAGQQRRQREERAPARDEPLGLQRGDERGDEGEKAGSRSASSEVPKSSTQNRMSSG